MGIECYKREQLEYKRKSLEKKYYSKIKNFAGGGLRARWLVAGQGLWDGLLEVSVGRGQYPGL